MLVTDQAFMQTPLGYAVWKGKRALVARLITIPAIDLAKGVAISF